MTEEDIKLEISKLKESFREAMTLLESPNNIQVVSELYSDLKVEVQRRYKELEKLDRNGRLNTLESAFLWPCIRDVYLHCDAVKGTKNKQKLGSSLYDGQDYCAYWLSQLDA